MNDFASSLLVVAISSRALFDFEEENEVFERGDTQAYMKMQRERIDIPAAPGVAFSLVKKLLAFNDAQRERVQVVVLSRNDPVSGLRVFRSIQEHPQLRSIQRGVFTQGRDPFLYLAPLGAHLFLSANGADVAHALELGYPAAQVAAFTSPPDDKCDDHEVRIAFDGDAVLFSDEAERVYQRDGLDEFQKHETELVDKPLPPGPFKPFLEALHRLQRTVENNASMKIRTALVTARSSPAHERAVRTLMAWGITVDEALFLGGLPKGEFLSAFQADFFFDDRKGHIEHAARHVPSGHVAAGICNPDGFSS